jgi:hypothetical protein
MMITTGAVLLMTLMPGAPAQALPRPVDPPELSVNDEMIVTTLIHMHKIVHRTAALGTSKASNGPIRAEARRVHSDLGGMLISLQDYGREHGYPDVMPGRTTARPTSPEFEAFLTSLRGLRVDEFNPAYLSVLSDFIGEMASIVEGATELATDPKLKGILAGMVHDLGSHQRQLELLLRLPQLQ